MFKTAAENELLSWQVILDLQKMEILFYVIYLNLFRIIF